MGKVSGKDQALGKNSTKLTDQVFPVVAVVLLFSRVPALWNPVDGSPPGSPVPGILQARTLEWFAISFSKCMKAKSESEVPQSCPTLCDPIDGSPPGSPVPGILQARTVKWAANAFSDSLVLHRR